MNNSVNCKIYDDVMLITLDRPKANAIDAKTSHALGDAFISFRAVSYTHLTLPTSDLV